MITPGAIRIQSTDIQVITSVVTRTHETYQNLLDREERVRWPVKCLNADEKRVRSYYDEWQTLLFNTDNDIDKRESHHSHQV